MKQQVAGRGDGMARTGSDFVEGMQLRRPRLAEEPVPGVGSDAKDAREVSLDVAEANGSLQGGQVGAKGSDGSTTRRAWLDRRDEEDGGARKGPKHRLWRGRGVIPWAWGGQRHWLIFRVA
jgi:hypothetical protein